METEIPRELTSAIDRHPLITTPDTLVPEAIALMSQIKYGCILVVTAKEGVKLPLGILTEQDVVGLIAAQTDLIDLPISGVMHRQLVTIREEQVEDIMALTHLLREYKTCYFPVVSDRGDLIGLLTPQSMQNTFKPLDLFRLKQVQEVIAASEPVVHTSEETSLLEVIHLMSEQSSNCVVITHRNIQGESNSLVPVGIITEWDILQFYHRGLDLAKTTAGLVMNTPLMLVQLTDSMGTVHQIMERLGVRRLVVSNAQGELAGVISYARVLLEIDPLETYQTVSTLKHLVQEQTLQLTSINKQLRAEVNEERLLEKKLASSENQLRAIIEVMTDVILTINLRNDQLGSIDIAPLNEKLRGDLHDPNFDRHLAVVNETIRTFFSGEVDWLLRVQRVLATARREQFDYALEINGQYLWFAVNISPITKDSVVWVARDISDRQAALQERNAMGTALTQIHQNYVDIAQTLAEIEQAQELSKVSIPISIPNQPLQQKLLDLINYGTYLTQGFLRGYL